MYRLITWLSIALFGVGPALAADNGIVLTNGAGVTLHTKDVGGGVQSPYQIPGDTSGNQLATAPGTPNGSFALPIQGVTGGSPIPVSQATAANLNATVVNGGTFAVQLSGATNNINNISGTISLPTGAALASNQTTALGILGNSNAGTVAHTCSVAGYSILSCAGQMDDDIKSPIAAGENHVGEVGGNQIAVQVAQTVTASSAYASGNAVGGLMTVANAARVSGSLGAGGSGGILQNVAVNAKSAQTAAMEVWIFNANPSGSTCTDKTAFVLATADFDKVVGVAAVPTTAANNSGWFSGSTGSVGQANNQAMAFDLSSATSLFACLVTRGTPTFTATSDISVKYNILRD